MSAAELHYQLGVKSEWIALRSADQIDEHCLLVVLSGFRSDGGR
jgi:hypothetical protein